MSTPFVHSSRRANIPIRFPCEFPDCRRWFGNKSGLTQHINRFHPEFLAFKPASNLSSLWPQAAPVEEHSNTPGDRNEPIRPRADMGDEAVNSQWHGPGALP